MRLFLAIDFPSEVKQVLFEVATELERQASVCRMVPLENYHLTLAFIGETSRVQEVEDVMHTVCRAFALREPWDPGGSISSNPAIAATYAAATAAHATAAGGSNPLRLVLNGIGSFKGPGAKGYTWWVGVETNPPLEWLAHQLSNALWDAEFAIEKRNFMPHITLGRGVVTKRPIELDLPSLDFNATHLSLMRSDHKQGQQVYTELSSAHW